MQLHLVTNRAPIAGSVAVNDKVVLMDAATSARLSNEILRNNPLASEAALLALDEIGYAQLVELVAESEGVISW
ncbi:MAG: hypothetical protein OXE81_06195 [Gammaproteobacteria bacterium]|nr:hypothetical protein [Gammaproteobacteria bacterium]